MLGLIWAQARGRAIGANGTIPWHVPEDFAFFKRSTLGAPVIMGRRTWDSLPARFRPLPGRRNIVVSRRGIQAPGADVASSFDQASSMTTNDAIAWVMGGAQLYELALPQADFAFVTMLGLDVDGADAFAPKIPDDWQEVAHSDERASRTGISYQFFAYARPGLELPDGIFQPN